MIFFQISIAKKYYYRMVCFVESSISNTDSDITFKKHCNTDSDIEKYIDDTNNSDIILQY